MAIYRPSPLVGAISGSAGGVQFLTGAGGNVVRARAGKRSQKTPPMLNEQAIYINAVRHWQGLTDAERLLWSTSAGLLTVQNRLGLPRILTGFQSFMRVAIPRFHVAGAYPNMPAEELVSPPTTVLVVGDFTAAALFFQLRGIEPFAVQPVQAYAGFSLNHPHWSRPRRMRLIFSGLTNITTIVAPIPTWPSDFALPQPGWRIYLEARFVLTDSWPGASAKTDFILT